MDKLSSNVPSEQNIHIKRLLPDILEAISSLLPREHPLLHVLSLPPPPSTAPLFSFIGILKDILATLRRRCAPLRDSEIDAEMQHLNSPPVNLWPADKTPIDRQQTLGTIKITPAAKFVVQSLKAILTIIDHMKSDLHNFLLGSMTEEQLEALVIREAKQRERDLVIKLWSPQSQSSRQQGEETIREHWRRWCKHTEETALPQEDRWKARLMKAIALSVPLKCAPPLENVPQNRTENELPPQFFLSCPALYQLQDYLQAIVIAATLRSLTRLPPPSSDPHSMVESPIETFMQRVWSLLETELEDPMNPRQTEDTMLKLINLADEVVRARRLAVGTLDPSVEQRLREAVKWTLQPNDPVFLLLQTRLMEVLLDRLIEKEGQQLPDKLRTGRSHPDEHFSKRPKLVFDDDELDELACVRGRSLPKIVGPAHAIKGFEGSVLGKAIGEAFNRLNNIVGWIECVWGDLV
jgi:hypothetical protein